MRRIYIVCMIVLLVMMSGCSGMQSKKPNIADNAPQRAFTVDELKTYNGQNGKSAYIAVDGVVYDVTASSYWKNGVHDKCSSSTAAGVDYSELVKTPFHHGKRSVKKFPVVGTLNK